MCSGRDDPNRRGLTFVPFVRRQTSRRLYGLYKFCGLRVGDHDDECGPCVPFHLGLPALPRAGSKPIDTVSCLLPEARGLAETWPHSLLRDPKEAELLRAELGLVRPSSNPSSVRRSARYSDFLHEACRAGVITLDKYAEATFGIFFVAKKNKQLRVIFDTRCVNVLIPETEVTSSSVKVTLTTLFA